MRPLAFFLTALALLQLFGYELLVLNFAVNQSSNNAERRVAGEGRLNFSNAVHVSSDTPQRTG